MTETNRKAIKAAVRIACRMIERRANWEEIFPVACIAWNILSENHQIPDEDFFQLRDLRNAALYRQDGPILDYVE